MYTSLYYCSKFKDKVDEAVRESGPSQRLHLQIEIAREMYKNETEEVKDKVRARLEELRRMDASINKQEHTDGPLDDYDVRKM